MAVISGGNVIGYGSTTPASNRVLRHTGVPVDGTSGTGVNIANKGDMLVNVSTGVLYINTGTLTNVTWTVVGTQT